MPRVLFHDPGGFFALTAEEIASRKIQAAKQVRVGCGVGGVVSVYIPIGSVGSHVSHFVARCSSSHRN